MNTAARALTALSLAATSLNAALVVNEDLGTLGPGTTNLVGTTAGGANNADTYVAAGAGSNGNWGNEFVYQFSVTQQVVASLSSNAITGDPDAFLLSGLETSSVGGKNDADHALSFAFLDAAPPETAGFGLLNPGTYFLSIDSFSGFDGAPDPMDATFDYTLDLSLLTQPVATDLGILGDDTSAFSIDTLGSALDTELGLYDAGGSLLLTNDDIDTDGGIFQSQLDLANLPVGHYFLALGGWDTGFAGAFGVDAPLDSDSGDFVLNYPGGLEGDFIAAGEVSWFAFGIIPEPSTMLLLGLAGLGVLRRRRV